MTSPFRRTDASHLDEAIRGALDLLVESRGAVGTGHGEEELTTLATDRPRLGRVGPARPWSRWVAAAAAVTLLGGGVAGLSIGRMAPVPHARHTPLPGASRSGDQPGAQPATCAGVDPYELTEFDGVRVADPAIDGMPARQPGQRAAAWRSERGDVVEIRWPAGGQPLNGDEPSFSPMWEWSRTDDPPTTEVRTDSLSTPLVLTPRPSMAAVGPCSWLEVVAVDSDGEVSRTAVYLGTPGHSDGGPRTIVPLAPLLRSSSPASDQPMFDRSALRCASMSQSDYERALLIPAGDLPSLPVADEVHSTAPASALRGYLDAHPGLLVDGWRQWARADGTYEYTRSADDDDRLLVGAIVVARSHDGAWIVSDARLSCS